MCVWAVGRSTVGAVFEDDHRGVHKVAQERERERDTPRLAIGIWMLHRCCGGPSDTAVEELPEVRGTLRAVNEDRTREYWHGAERKREVVHRKDRSFSWNNEEYKERSE